MLLDDLYILFEFFPHPLIFLLILPDLFYRLTFMFCFKYYPSILFPANSTMTFISRWPLHFTWIHTFPFDLPVNSTWSFLLIDLYVIMNLTFSFDFPAKSVMTFFYHLYITHEFLPFPLIFLLILPCPFHTSNDLYITFEFLPFPLIFLSILPEPLF